MDHLPVISPIIVSNKQGTINKTPAPERQSREEFSQEYQPNQQDDEDKILHISNYKAKIEGSPEGSQEESKSPINHQANTRLGQHVLSNQNRRNISSFDYQQYNPYENNTEDNQAL